MSAKNNYQRQHERNTDTVIGDWVSSLIGDVHQFKPPTEREREREIAYRITSQVSSTNWYKSWLSGSCWQHGPEKCWYPAI